MQHGRGSSKLSEVVKLEEFTQSSLTDESFSVLNLHMPSGFGGASTVLVILGLSCAGYLLAKWQERRKTATRRAATSLEIQKLSRRGLGYLSWRNWPRYSNLLLC